MTEYIDVNGDGKVVIYKRENLKNPKYQARLKIPGATGYKRISTKTDNQRQAERIALDAYEELYFRVRQGGSINSYTFKQVYDEWVKTLNHRRTIKGNSYKQTADRVSSYALKFFGDMKIESITTKHFIEFWQWRQSNYARKPPSANTLKREKTAMMPVFTFAKNQAYIADIPNMDTPSASKVRRPTFSLEEWRRVTRSMREWIKEGEKKATLRERIYATQYFLILANSGLRVGEARNLKWQDLRSVKTASGPRIIAEVRGKTGVREVVFQKGSEEYFKRIWKHRCEELQKQTKDDETTRTEPSLDEIVFCNRQGDSIHTFKRAFKSLIQFSGIPIEKLGEARTIYSLRHFYATQRLQDNTNPFHLAKQMGTSIEMLQDFYGQTLGSELAEQLTKTTTRTKISELNLPFL